MFRRHAARFAPVCRNLGSDENNADGGSALLATTPFDPFRGLRSLCAECDTEATMLVIELESLETMS